MNRFWRDLSDTLLVLPCSFIVDRFWADPHPKIPLAKFTPYIDAYLKAHPGALVLLATDDAANHASLLARYPGKVVSAGSGYRTANIVRDPSIDRHAKGRTALVDALLLAHTDFLLKGTSSLSEFALWYSPTLIERHLDL